MARNSEKAQSMLFRFREAQAADLGIIDAGRARRPRRITDQTSVASCERWRGQVLRDISRKVSRIQESALSDFQIRDLNDDINKLLREKHVWEVHIRSLGGPNYAARTSSSRLVDEAGHEVPGARRGGYRYFGRARDLPGVRELFDAAADKARERREAAAAGRKPLEARDDLRRQVDAAYYGYGPDEDDAAVQAYEAAKEELARANLVGDDDGHEQDPEPPDGWEPLPGDRGDGSVWDLPTLDEVHHELLERRKRRMLDQL